MSSESTPMHFVSTRDELRKVMEVQQRFFVMNCGCRAGNEKGCKRSRPDVCLVFTVESGGSGGTEKREIGRAEAMDLLRLAEEKRLVTRPFRSEDRKSVEGSCFCCDDCCGYFHGDEYKCDKGAMIEATKADACNDCGECVAACYFGARKMQDGKLAVDRERCFGCGLCVDVCPTDAIEIHGRC